MSPERFWTLFHEQPETGCLVWLYGKNHDEYGKVNSSGLVDGPSRTLLTHRVVWILKRGPIPEGLRILHTCDNRPCGNINHLFIGTQQDNIRDMIEKGRGARGDTHGTVKFTLAEAEEIRKFAMENSLPTADLARNLGVSVGTVSTILNGTRYGLGAPVERPELASRLNKAQKLTPEMAIEIRRRAYAGERQDSIGKAFGITQATVSRIVNRVRRPDDAGPQAKETNGARKLTRVQVREIQGRLARGEPHASIAASYGVIRESISKLAQGRSYQQVTGGEVIRKHTLTSEQRQEIRQRLARGERQVDLAKLFQVSQSQISLVKLQGQQASEV